MRWRMGRRRQEDCRTVRPSRLGRRHRADQVLPDDQVAVIRADRVLDPPQDHFVRGVVQGRQHMLELE